MKISLVTPAGKQSRSGNRATAVRWARIFSDLDHDVNISEADEGSGADLMVAIHAWRSAASIRAFAQAHPSRPLVVLLSGTDIYRFQQSHKEETQASMAMATVLVGLHDMVHRSIPARFHDKLRVIRQSAPPLDAARAPGRRHFDVCVVGHLREEKDPLRTAEAARLLPEASRLRVVHLGKAHDETWARDAEAEMRINPRYRWLGEVPPWQVRRQFAKSHAMVISSVMEGGANVVSEAVMADLPVIASLIDGNEGLLGSGYGGYFPAKDSQALAALLWRAEKEPAFLKGLARQCRDLRPLFEPAAERTAWQGLLADLGG